uniref:Uncharacterized protein n=1 Tax=Sphaerodactylus townsendi TaxID=933632 RepID=A0ACB8G1V6_9SAUR
MDNSLDGNELQELISWLTRPLSAFIILANLFIIIGIIFNHKLHGVINWFFLSLLFADLLAGAALPTIPQLVFKKKWGYHLCFFIYVTPNFIFLSFLANLLVVHYAKYVCIIHPLHYHKSWVYRWAALYLFLAWTAPLIFACLPFIWNHWQPHVNCSSRLVFPMPYLYLETYGLLIPTILAMVFMCIQVLCVARRQLKNITKLLHSVNRGQAPSALEQQLELRNVKAIAGVSLIFLVMAVQLRCPSSSVLATANTYSFGGMWESVGAAAKDRGAGKSKPSQNPQWHPVSLAPQRQTQMEHRANIFPLKTTNPHQQQMKPGMFGISYQV